MKPTQTIKIHALGDVIAGALFLPEHSRSAPALIICHGAGEFKENYYELCEFLTHHGIAALALDMHGHGESEGERYHVNMQEWIADVQAAIRFLNQHPRVSKGKIGAFGLSSGATAILETASIDPELKAIVVLDATVRSSIPWALSLIFKILIVVGRIKKRFTRSGLRLPLLKWMGDIKLVSDPEIEKELKSNPKNIEALMSFPLPGAEQSFFVNTIEKVFRIKVPTMVIWGAEDQLDPPTTAQMLYDSLSCEKQLHVVPGNGHAGHLDRNRQQVFTLTADWVLKKLA